jgi:hypothetical protein
MWPGSPVRWGRTVGVPVQGLKPDSACQREPDRLVTQHGAAAATTRGCGVGRLRPLERAVALRSRKARAAIPRGDFRLCDPRSKQTTTGASVRLADAAQPRPLVAAAAENVRAARAFPARGSGPRTDGATAALRVHSGPRQEARIELSSVRQGVPSLTREWLSGAAHAIIGVLATCGQCPSA